MPVPHHIFASHSSERHSWRSAGTDAADSSKALEPLVTVLVAAPLALAVDAPSLSAPSGILGVLAADAPLPVAPLPSASGLPVPVASLASGLQTAVAPAEGVCASSDVDTAPSRTTTLAMGTGAHATDTGAGTGSDEAVVWKADAHSGHDAGADDAAGAERPVAWQCVPGNVIGNVMGMQDACRRRTAASSSPLVALAPLFSASNGAHGGVPVLVPPFLRLTPKTEVHSAS